MIGGIGIAPFGESKDTAELQKFYIVKDHQGKGYGSMLYQTAEKFAKNQGFQKIYIETVDVLGQANKTYAHFGFQKLEKPLEGSEHELMNRWFIKDL